VVAYQFKYNTHPVNRNKNFYLSKLQYKVYFIVYHFHIIDFNSTVIQLWYIPSCLYWKLLSKIFHRYVELLYNIIISVLISMWWFTWQNGVSIKTILLNFIIKIISPRIEWIGKNFLQKNLIPLKYTGLVFGLHALYRRIILCRLDVQSTILTAFIHFITHKHH